ISYKIGLNFRNDSVDFPLVLKKIPESIIRKFTHIIGDKGYDSEKNHQIARSYGLISVIPARNEDVPVYSTRGYYRKKMKRKLPDEYRERAKVETVHSVIKRRFGDFLRSMDKINSRKEEIMKFLVYNITRIIKITKNYEKLIFQKGFLLSSGLIYSIILFLRSSTISFV
ncbi:MAG: transposase, partial [Thermoplasmata archaeon]